MFFIRANRQVWCWHEGRRLFTGLYQPFPPLPTGPCSSRLTHTIFTNYKCAPLPTLGALFTPESHSLPACLPASLIHHTNLALPTPAINLESCSFVLPLCWHSLGLLPSLPTPCVCVCVCVHCCLIVGSSPLSLRFIHCVCLCLCCGGPNCWGLEGVWGQDTSPRGRAHPCLGWLTLLLSLPSGNPRHIG